MTREVRREGGIHAGSGQLLRKQRPSEREPLGQDPDVSRRRLTLVELSRKGTYVQHGGGPQGLSGRLEHKPQGDAAWIKAKPMPQTDLVMTLQCFLHCCALPALPGERARQLPLWLLNLALSPSFLPLVAGEPWLCPSPTAARKAGKVVSGSLPVFMGKWLCLLRLGIPQAQEGGHTLGNQKE